jgi:hypothetical protein
MRTAELQTTVLKLVHPLHLLLKNLYHYDGLHA